MCIRDRSTREQVLQSVICWARNQRPKDGAETLDGILRWAEAVSYTHLRANETVLDFVCRLLLEKKKKEIHIISSSNADITTTEAITHSAQHDTRRQYE